MENFIKIFKRVEAIIAKFAIGIGIGTKKHLKEEFFS